MLVNRVGTMALPFLVVYLTRERHLPAETSGLVLGLYGVGSLIAGPLAGWALPKLGARPILVASLVGSGGCLLALAWVENPTASGALVLAWAVTTEAFRPVCSSVIASHVAVAERRNAFAALRLSANLGMTIGPAVGGLLASRSYEALVAVDAGTSFAAAGCLLVAGSAVSIIPAWTTPVSHAGALRRGHATLAVHLLGVGLIALVGYQGLSTMALYMTDTLKLGETAYGFAFSLSGLVIVLCELPLTTRLAHWTHRRALTIGSALTAFGFAALAGSASLSAVIVATFVWTTGEMLLSPAAAARVADLEPPHRAGLFMGLYSATWSVAFALGPWLGMHSVKGFGPRLHWVVVGGVGLLAAAIFSSQIQESESSAPG